MFFCSVFVFCLSLTLSSNDGQSNVDLVGKIWSFAKHAKVVKSVRTSSTTEVAIDFSKVKGAN